MARRAPHWRFDDESVSGIIDARATMPVDGPESEPKQAVIAGGRFRCRIDRQKPLRLVERSS